VASHVDLAALLPGRWAAEMEPRWIEVPLAISEWIGDDLVVDADELAGAVSTLAKRWSQRPAANPARST